MHACMPVHLPDSAGASVHITLSRLPGACFAPPSPPLSPQNPGPPACGAPPQTGLLPVLLCPTPAHRIAALPRAACCAVQAGPP